jgi:hypothetical protein
MASSGGSVNSTNQLLIKSIRYLSKLEDPQKFLENAFSYKFVQLLVEKASIASSQSLSYDGFDETHRVQLLAVLLRVANFVFDDLDANLAAYAETPANKMTQQMTNMATFYTIGMLFQNWSNSEKRFIDDFVQADGLNFVFRVITDDVLLKWIRNAAEINEKKIIEDKAKLKGGEAVDKESEHVADTDSFNPLPTPANDAQKTEKDVVEVLTKIDVYVKNIFQMYLGTAHNLSNYQSL